MEFCTRRIDSFLLTEVKGARIISKLNLNILKLNMKNYDILSKPFHHLYFQWLSFTLACN